MVLHRPSTPSKRTHNIFYPACCLVNEASATIIEDKYWRQLTETIHFSYTDLPPKNICSAVTGTCNGSLHGVDLTGWAWATRTDVGALFESLLPNNTVNFAAGAFYDAVEDGPNTQTALDFDGDGTDTGLFNILYSDGITGWLWDVPSPNPLLKVSAAALDYDGYTITA